MILIVICLLALAVGFLLGWIIKDSKSQHNLQQLRQNHLEAEKKISELESQKASHQSTLSEHFKNLSQEIIETKYQQFQNLTEQNLAKILTPLKEKLQSFQKKVEDTYNQESQQRFSLKETIKDLCQAHDQLKETAQNLTQALKGDFKAQGQWGEMILNTILKNSGLIENEHYTTQGKELNLKTEEGKTQKPDVVIKLPDKKHLVIDAKVSLTHYESFISAVTQEKKEEYLALFLKSLRNHVNQLSDKNYYLGKTIDAPDFTMMFFPMEAAFSLALQSDRGLFEYSWQRSIVIVSPTTLLATLKTVESIWKREKQNRNAMEIANMGGSLYDKFISFTQDLQNIGSSIEKANDSYKKAISKLHTGKGNIVSKLHNIKKLGARTTKELPDHFLPTNE